MKPKISLIIVALCVAGFVGGQSFDYLASPLVPKVAWSYGESGYRTDVERIVNTGTNLFIYYREHGMRLNVSCAVLHPPGDVCDFGKVDRRWRHAYGVSNNLIVDLGRQDPTAVVGKTTNITETVIEWTYESN